MANLKFVASADVREVIKASKDVQRVLDQMERGWAEVGDSAERASKDAKRAMHETAQAYQLAEARPANLRVRGATSRTTGGARAYGVAPMAAQPLASAGIAAFAGANLYRTARTDNELFERFTRAQEIRGQRRLERMNLTTGSGNLWAMGSLLDRGSASLDAGVQRTEERARRRELLADIDRETRLNKFQQQHAEREENRKKDRAIIGRGAAIGGVGVIAAVAGVDRAMDEARESTVTFNDALRPLATLGENIKNIAGLREEILTLGAAYGKSSEQIIAARYSIESANPDTTKEQRDEILKLAMQYNATGNTDPLVAARAISKSQSIFPDVFKTPTAASNVIDYLADKGDLDPEQLATYLPDLYATAQAMGFDPIEVGAAYAAVSQKTGRREPTYTGLRNMMLRSGDAREKLGMDLGRDMPTLLANVAGLESEQMKELFGAESIAIAQVAAEARAQIAEYTAGGRGQLTAPSRQDAKHRQMLADPSYAYTTRMQRVDQMIKDMPLTGGYLEQWGEFDTRVKDSELGIAAALPQTTPQIVKDSAKWFGVLGETIGAGRISSTLANGPRGGLKGLIDIPKVSVNGSETFLSRMANGFGGFGLPEIKVNGVDAFTNPVSALGAQYHDSVVSRAGLPLGGGAGVGIGSLAPTPAVGGGGVNLQPLLPASERPTAAAIARMDQDIQRGRVIEPESEAAHFGKVLDKFSDVIDKFGRIVERDERVVNTKSRNAHE